jgi:hypothetical protein
MIIEISENKLKLDLNMLEELNIKTKANDTVDCNGKSNLVVKTQQPIQTLQL